MREFQVGDYVMRQADTLKDIEKLEATWEGPYKTVTILAGGNYELEEGKWNFLSCSWPVGHLKKCYA